MSQEAATATKPQRLHSLDLVRAAALLLGIVFHAALSMLPGPQVWLVEDTQQSVLLSAFSFTSHSFRMTTFFLLAGFFGHMMVVRKGIVSFGWDRTKRIFTPLVAFWLPTLMGFGAAMALAASLGAIPAGAIPAEDPPLMLETFPLTHLWFLYLLMIFYIAMLAARAISSLIDRNESFSGGIDALMGAAIRIPLLLAAILIIPTSMILFYQPDWVEWWGIPTPDTGLVPNRAAVVIYGLAFAFGWLIHRAKDAIFALEKHWIAHMVLAVGATIAGLALAGTNPAVPPQFTGADKLLFAAIYAGMIWGWTFGIIGMAMRFIKQESPKVRYMADASYWLYIVHLPLVVALQAWAALWTIPAELKLLVVLSVAMAIMLGTYHLLVRFSWLGAWLNGKKYARKGKAKLDEAEGAMT